MKLTNTMRKQFVDDVLAGIPVKHHFDMRDAKSEIINAIEAKLPSEILKVVKENPQIIIRSKRFKLDELSYLNSDGFKRTPEIYTVQHESCKMIDFTAWVNLKELADIEQEERKVLHARLLEISNSCSTLTKLKVALPELESYMPAEVVKRDLPVASGTVVTDLLQLGLKIPK